MRKAPGGPSDAGARSTGSGHARSAVRRRAEARLKRERTAGGKPLPEVETTRLLQQLQIHQIELERQNEELRASRASLALHLDLHDSAPVGFLTLGPDGAIRRVNLAGARLLGVERSRSVTRRFGQFVAAEDRPAFAEFLSRVFANPVKKACDIRLVPEGAVVHIEGTRSPGGLECELVALDITERERAREQARELLAGVDRSRHALLSVIEDQKRAETALSRLNAELEQRIADRTAALVAANGELESFSYAVSHDLRAPLRAISGFSAALVEDFGPLLPDEAKGFLNEIKQATLNMAQLIDGLLTLSRTNRVEVSCTRVDLSALSERVCRALARAEPTRLVQWHVEEGLTAWGDARLLEVVMSNLLGNAWKYTAQCQTPYVKVYAEHTGARPCYCVADNGVGFDMRHKDRLFKVFQRLHRQDEFPGIGIGLATVLRVIHRHGGTLSATAVVCEGATFRFDLPDPAVARLETT